MRKKILQSRATEEEVNLLKEASNLRGLRLNSFVRSSAIKEARRIIKENSGGSD